MSNVVLKDPNEVIDVSVDWTDVLATGETISSQSWAIEGASSSDTSPLATSGSASESNGVTTQLVQAGTEGEVYTVRNRIVTNQGRTYDRSRTVRVGTR